jgi:hypothetical protein
VLQQNGNYRCLTTENNNCIITLIKTNFQPHEDEKILCRYAVDDMDPEDINEFGEEQFVQYFSITSDYEIRLMDYTKKEYQARLDEVYHVDESRKFALTSSREE